MAVDHALSNKTSFCTCVFAGTFTILSVMVGSVTERLAPDASFLILNGTNVTQEVNITARDLYRVQVAAATTVLGGLIQVCAHIYENGDVMRYANMHVHTHVMLNCF